MSKLAVVQMVSSASVVDNLQRLEPYFAQAKAQGVALLALPENFAFMGMEEKDKYQIAEVLGVGLIQETLANLAKRYGLWVLAGTVPITASKERVRSSCFVMDATGCMVARYDKIHLFDVSLPNQENYHESATIEPGTELVVVDTPVGRIGLTVCYDLRFPELYRQLVIRGAELLSVPSAFTAITGRAHWEVLLRARAIENLCYVVAPNQGGTHANGRETYGHSMVVDPWGQIISQLNLDWGMIVVDIDLQQLRQLRDRFQPKITGIFN